MKYTLLLWLFIAAFPYLLSAQTGSGTSAACYNTMNRLQEIQVEHPEVEQTMTDIENFISQAIAMDGAEELITIPVVFHVLYDEAAQQINQEKIQELLDALNHSFNDEFKTVHNSGYEAEGFASLQAVMNIEFCMSTIQYVNSASLWQADDAFKTIAPPIAPLLNLNVWLVEIENSCRGYAQLPGGPAILDGVVLNTAYLQDQISDYHKASIIHLVANYLGLYPLWGACKCCDDFVADTPIANAPNPRCYEAGHSSFCGGNPRELTTNYLDANNNECGAIFTKGQVQRVKAVLSDEGPRGLLKTGAAACLGTIENRTNNEHNDIQQPANSNSLNSSLEVFPNPAQQSFTIKSSHRSIQIDQITIYDQTGRSMFFADNVNQISLDIDCKKWQNAYYIIKVLDSQKQYHFNSIIVLQ